MFDEGPPVLPYLTLINFFKGCMSKFSHILRYQGLGASSYEFWGKTILSIARKLCKVAKVIELERDGDGTRTHVRPAVKSVPFCTTPMVVGSVQD